jgi:DNA-binding response OmpR family regulator
MARILIIDDDHQFRKMLRQTLTRREFEVGEASNGNQALEELTRTAYDLVILDLIMPGMEGVEMTIELCKKFPELKIIAVSGGSPKLDPDITLTAVKLLGADHILKKPFGSEELFGAINRLVRA